MEVIVKEFDELSLDELYSILKLRFDVFVIEQNCIYNEIDDKDKDSLHLFLKDNNEVVAYCRLYKRSETVASLGRIVVRKDFRGEKLGKIIIQKGIDIAKNDLKMKKIEMHAQQALEKYYESYGFKTTSEPYTDTGILHIDMELQFD